MSKFKSFLLLLAEFGCILLLGAVMFQMKDLSFTFWHLIAAICVVVSEILLIISTILTFLYIKIKGE